MLDKIELVTAFRYWLAQRQRDLSAAGFTSDLTESPEDRDPASVWLVLESDATIAEVIAWTNGLVDVKSVDVETAESVEMHREIKEVSQVSALIDQVLRIPSV